MVAFLACGSGDDPVLVTVEGQPIRWSEYRDAYIDYLAGTGLEDEPSRRRGFLERLVSMRLVVLEGRDAGLASTPEFAAFEEKAARRLLVDAFLADAAFDTLTASREELEAMFVRVNTRITARHLYANSAEEAAALKRRLDSGETFESLAREVFVDSTLAAGGGSVGTFGFDEMDPSFEDAAYALPVGAVSDPVRTAQGWSVIRVDDRSVNPLLTAQQFAERLPELSRYVVERRRSTVRREWSDRLVAELAPRVEPATASGLLDRIAGVGPSEAGPGDDAVLVHFRAGGRDRAWNVAEFRRQAELASDRQRASVTDARSLEAFIVGLLVREEMARRAVERDLDGTPRYRRALATAIEEWLYERSFARLAARVPVPEDSVTAYFDRHRDEFTLPRAVRISEIASATKRTADSLRTALGAAEFGELARRHSVRATAGTGGDLGWLTDDDLGPWARAAFSADPGDVLGPLEMRGQYLLLEVGERRDARPADFDDVKNAINEQLARESQRDFLREHVTLLRERYEVRYAEKGPESYPLVAETHRTS